MSVRALPIGVFVGIFGTAAVATADQIDDFASRHSDLARDAGAVWKTAQRRGDNAPTADFQFEILSVGNRAAQLLADTARFNAAYIQDQAARDPKLLIAKNNEPVSLVQS
jgi:hypothetical protein